MSSTPVRISALDTLRAISKKKPAPGAPELAAQTQDPAIAGAKLNRTTVQLGLDPKFTATAKKAAELDAILKAAEADFKILQSEVRDYGKMKREVYNDAFKANVQTVGIPYEVETPTGLEKKYVQVTCTNRYSVQQEMVFGNREKFGESYFKLFEEERVKTLKPNAEELIRGVLQENGLEGEDLEAAMSSLFEEEIKVKTTDKYEVEAKKVTDEHLVAVLDQAVVRAQPAVKFG